MGRKFKIYDSDKLYFLTFTIVEWIRVFDNEVFINIFLDSIRYCQKNKGLEVYAWVIMPNHVHMVIGRNGPLALSDIIRDIKGYTSRLIKKHLIVNEGSLMVEIMRQTGLNNSRNKNFQLWQQHNHPIEIEADIIFYQKIDYIHNNPVVAGLANAPEEWPWSSAIDFAEGKGLLDLTWA